MWQLKRRTEIKPGDLPYIEAAFFAVSKLNVSRYATFDRVVNLDQALKDCDGFGSTLSGRTQDWRNDQRWQQLIDCIERYEMVLVCSHFDPPFAPVFRKQAPAENTPSEAYEIRPQHVTQHEHLHGLLRRVNASSSQQSSAGAGAAAGAVAAVIAAGSMAGVAATAGAARAAMRSAEHTEKRYTLLVALAYKAQRLFLNRVAAVQCKLENEFTGPESRRSGPIKASDPAYYDLRRRELREGNYTLIFTRPPLAARKLKASRAKA